MNNEARARWESRYAASEESVWSGDPHPLLVELASSLEPGVSIDVGAGEGADTLWLAGQGWLAHGIDFSPTAVARATKRARKLGLENAYFHASDFQSFVPSKPANLVTAFFLHPRGEREREVFLRSAASWVAPRGHLLLVAHADRRPGSTSGPPSVDPALDQISLEETGNWQFLVAHKIPRESGGHTRQDSVIFARKS